MRLDVRLLCAALAGALAVPAASAEPALGFHPAADGSGFAESFSVALRDGGRRRVDPGRGARSRDRGGRRAGRRPPVKKPKWVWIGGLSALAIGGSYYNARSDGPQYPFHFTKEGWFGQNTYSGGGDKASHFVSYYIVAKLMSGVNMELGMSVDDARLLGTGVAWLAGVATEIGDGGNKYGFSWEDITMDTLGAATALAIGHYGLDDLIGFRAGRVSSPTAPCCPYGGTGKDYSEEIYTGDLKIAGLGERARFNPGIARVSSVLHDLFGQGLPVRESRRPRAAARIRGRDQLLRDPPRRGRASGQVVEQGPLLRLRRPALPVHADRHVLRPQQRPLVRPGHRQPVARVRHGGGAPRAMSSAPASFRRTLRVVYPLKEGRIGLRTEADWQKDIEPDETDAAGHTFTFTVESEKPFLYFKPVLHVGDELFWTPGANRLVLMTEPDTRPVYPHFRSKGGGRFAPPIEFDSTRLGRRHHIRVYLPPGYNENTLKHYAVLYMQDGQNLFFPDEAFLGNDWHVDETVGVLDTMSVVDDFIVVGVYSKDRFAEYTKPGYETYGESLVGEVKPRIDEDFRTLPGPLNTGLIGSSLGGVVSFYLAWEWPDVFGRAGCLSSTFGYRDDLLERVLSEDKREVGYYLDSGWPEDNYEVTVSMAMALVSRGWEFGRDLMHFAFPLAEHDEKAWGLRLHLPLQLFSGIVRKASAALHAPHPSVP